MSTSKNQSFQLYPIGVVHQEQDGAMIEIYEAYRPALKEMGQFGYAIVFWWADGADTPEGRAVLQCELPYARGTIAGVFACRSQNRPNPIAITTAYILEVDQEKGTIRLPWLDAEDGSPVIDLKPYIPMSDRPRDVKVAEWLAGWPEYMEDAGEFFATHAIDFGD